MEINLGNVPPIFAHDVAMSTITRTKKTKKGKIVKESHTEMIFIDSVRKAALVRIVLPPGVLEEMPKMIEENLRKTSEELKNNEMPKEQKIETKTKGSYFG